MNNVFISLDFSSFYWDEEDYNLNTTKYYDLTEELKNLILILDKEKPNILLRDSLLEEIQINFPYNKIPKKGRGAFITLVKSFLSNTNFISYSTLTEKIISKPNLIKSHFNENMKNEIDYLISEMHLDSDKKNIFITFDYLWKKNGNLETVVGDTIKNYETIISDIPNAINLFFDELKPKFEHNSKHDCEEHKSKERFELRDTTKDFVSQLTCFKNQKQAIAQRILDKAIKFESEYIGYDEVNDYWVRFKCHRKNLYHGFDEYDDENEEKIPLEIKRKFHK